MATGRTVYLAVTAVLVIGTWAAGEYQEAWAAKDLRQAEGAVVQGGVRGLAWEEEIAGAVIELSHADTGQALGTTTTDEFGDFQLDAPSTDVPLALRCTADDYETYDLPRFFAPINLLIWLTPAVPRAPTGLDAFPAADEILLCWDPLPEAGLAGYHVYRGPDYGGPFEQITTRPVTAPRYRDSDVVAGTAYFYRVTSVREDDVESLPGGTVGTTAGLIVVEVPDVDVPLGSCTRIPINLANAAGIAPNGLQIDFRYDSAIIDPESLVVERTAITSALDFTADTSEAGRVVIAAAVGGDVLVGEGHLFDIYACPLAQVQTGQCGSLEFESVTLLNTLAQPLTIDVADTGQFCVSNACILGDLDSNGFIEEEDARICLQIAVKLIPYPTPCQLRAGDLNGDGVVDSADAAFILRMLAGQPVNPTSLDDPWSLRSLLSGGSAVAVSLPTATADPGATVDIPLSIDDATGIGALDFTVGFPADEAALVLDEVLPGTLTADFETVAEAGPGYVRVSMSGISAIGQDQEQQSGSLAILRFSLPETTQDGVSLPLTISGIELKGQYGDQFDWFTDVNTTDGLIAVGFVPGCCAGLPSKEFTARVPRPKSLAGDAFVLALAGLAIGRPRGRRNRP